MRRLPEGKPVRDLFHGQTRLTKQEFCFVDHLLVDMPYRRPAGALLYHRIQMIRMYKQQFGIVLNASGIIRHFR